MRVVFQAVALVIGLALPGSVAAATLYQCVFEPSRANSWVPGFVFVGFDPNQNDRVVVSDEIILFFNDGTPAEGRVAVDNPRRVTFAWELVVASRGERYVRMNYRLTYLRGNGQATMSARPLGFDTVFQARGMCDVETTGDLTLQ